MKERLVRFGQFLKNTPSQSLYILFDLLLSIPAHTNHSLDGPSPGDYVVTINNGAIKSVLSSEINGAFRGVWHKLEKPSPAHVLNSVDLMTLPKLEWPIRPSKPPVRKNVLFKEALPDLERTRPKSWAGVGRKNNVCGLCDLVNGERDATCVV